MTGGGKLAEAFVEIGADDRRLPGGLSAAMGRIRGFAAEASSLIGRALGQSLVRGVAGAGNLNESLSKTEVVFGRASDKILGFADNMVAKFGSARREILDAASGFGLIFRGANMAEGASANLAIRLATAADDAASLFNSSLPEALEKIRAGLVGESEPLRAYGVMLSEAAVQQEALRFGLAKTKDTLTESAKIMARASLIEKGLAVAKGDHERTQDGLNNSLKEAAGRFTNLTEKLGAMATGPLAIMAQFTSGVIAKVSELADAFEDASAKASLFFRTGSTDLEEDIEGRYNAIVKHERESKRQAKELQHLFKTTPSDDARMRAEALLSRAREGLTTGLGMAGQLKNDALGVVGRVGGILAGDEKPKLRGGVTDSDSYARELQDSFLNTENTGKETVDELKKHTNKLDEMLKVLGGGARDIIGRFG